MDRNEDDEKSINNIQMANISTDKITITRAIKIHLKKKKTLNKKVYNNL